MNTHKVFRHLREDECCLYSVIKQSSVLTGSKGYLLQLKMKPCLFSLAVWINYKAEYLMSCILNEYV